MQFMIDSYQNERGANAVNDFSHFAIMLGIREWPLDIQCRVAVFVEESRLMLLTSTVLVA
jgi:hypothetical protein